MDRSKFIAIFTGAISLILALAYLLLVTVLDFRGEMLPAPTSQLPVSMQIQQLAVAHPNLTLLKVYPKFQKFRN